MLHLPDSLTSISCGIFTTLMETFFKAALLVIYATTEHHMGIFSFQANHWSTWFIFFILFGLVYYWAHRWSHELNLLWGVHVPHHQSEQYNLTTALRQGAFQDLFHWPIFLTLALLGYPVTVFIIQLTLSKFYQYWIHTRLIGKIPWIEGILNTPSAHRVYHGINDQYIDKNHGATLMIWDRIFGTWQQEMEEPIYGVRKSYHSWNPIWAHFDWFYLP